MELVEKTKRRIRVERNDDPFVVAQGFVEILKEAGINVEVVKAYSEEAAFLEYLVEKSSCRIM